MRDRGQSVPLHAANIWVYPNARNSREILKDQAPFILNALRGIAVYRGDFPRIPILGLRAIVENKLVLKVDGARREATLRTSHKWWWPFE